MIHPKKQNENGVQKSDAKNWKWNFDNSILGMLKLKSKFKEKNENSVFSIWL